MHPILLSSLVATLAILLLTQLHRVPADLRRPVEIAVEVTILAALAITGVVTVIMVVADTVKGRRATDRGVVIMTVPAVEITAADMVATDMALAAMVRAVAVMDRAGPAMATGTTATRATAEATPADRVRAPATVAATMATTAAVRAMGTATTRTAAMAAATRTATGLAPATEGTTTGTAEAAVVKP